jgi:hypothetical protein
MKILPGAFPRLFSILLVSLLLVGCGGGSPSSHGTAGRATFNILWPNRSRLIPAASNSIRINIKRGATVTTTRLVPRPAEGGTSTVTFDSLPVGTLTAIAAAYPQADGSGTVQAQGTLPVNVQDGLNINFSLTMDSTIDHIEVTPPNPTVSAGGTVQLTATAKDSLKRAVGFLQQERCHRGFKRTGHGESIRLQHRDLYRHGEQ